MASEYMEFPVGRGMYGASARMRRFQNTHQWVTGLGEVSRRVKCRAERAQRIDGCFEQLAYHQRDRQVGRAANPGISRVFAEADTVSRSKRLQLLPSL